MEEKKEVKEKTENKEIEKAVKENIEVVKELQEDDSLSVFITEKDTFDVTVRYYRKDDKFFVDAVDEDYDQTAKYKEFIVTLKYPDQSDCINIASTAKMNPDPQKMDVRDFVNIEFTRFLVLIRKWSVNKQLSRENIMNVNPKIVKGLLAIIRNKIGIEGII